jgi:hypothetical protein
MALMYLINKPQVFGKLVKLALIICGVWIQDCIQT